MQASSSLRNQSPPTYLQNEGYWQLAVRVAWAIN